MIEVALILLVTGVCVQAWTGKGKVDPDLELAFRMEDLLYVVKGPPQPRVKRDTADTFEGSGEGDVLPPATPDFGNVDPVTVSTEFHITSMDVSEFNKSHFSSLLSDKFRKVPGFERVIITDVRNGSVFVDFTVMLNAEEVNDKGWKYTENIVLLACMDVANSPDYNITNATEKWIASSSKLSDQLENICNSSDHICSWGSRLNCTDGKMKCTFLCDDFPCDNSGHCSVSVSNHPVCRCEADDYYDYSGERCETASLKWEIVLAVSAGLGGAAAVILGVVLIVMCCRRRRGKSADNFSTQRDSGQGVGRYRAKSTWASSGRLGKSLYRSSFFSPSLEAGTTPDCKLFQSGRGDYGWVNYYNDQDSLQDIYPDFTPTLDHIDTQADKTPAVPNTGTACGPTPVQGYICHY